MSLPQIHRVVTGHDSHGKAIVLSDGPLATVTELKAVAGTVFHEVWNTWATPALITSSLAPTGDPTMGPITLPPPKSGTRIRYVDIPPDSAEFLAKGVELMKSAFGEIGDSKATTATNNSPHPLMHRTETIDYGIVIEGELTLVLDDSEVDLKVGSVVVQRGTNHAWANRSNKTCRMLFILVDGHFENDLKNQLAAIA